MDNEKCHRCDGTGFKDGKVCRCITGKKIGSASDIPDIFKDIFGAFDGVKPSNDGEKTS